MFEKFFSRGPETKEDKIRRIQKRLSKISSDIGYYQRRVSEVSRELSSSDLPGGSVGARGATEGLRDTTFPGKIRSLESEKDRLEGELRQLK